MLFSVLWMTTESRSSIPSRKRSLPKKDGVTSSPSKVYLREMGSISLLTREGEIAIAREIERGEKSIIKALSKTRLVLNEILDLEEKIKEEPDIIYEMFEISEEDFAEGKLESKKKQLMGKIKKIRELSIELDKIPDLKKNTLKRGRIIVKMSSLIRELNIRLEGVCGEIGRMKEELK